MEQITSTKLFPPWKELVKVASNWEYGTIHTHDEIADIMGLSYPSQEYYQQVNHAITELITYGKRMKNVQNRGYYTLKPVEQIHEAVYDAKRGTRRIKDGIHNLTNAPVDDMTDSQKRTQEGALVSLSRTYVNAVNGVTETARIAGIQRKQKMLMKGKED
jgi:hypothetical protein